MPTTGIDNSFPFVISNGPKPPRSARALIRKQAMRDAGVARRKKGGHGRVNIRQPIVHNDEAADPNASNGRFNASMGSAASETFSSEAQDTSSPETSQSSATLVDVDTIVPRNVTDMSVSKRRPRRFNLLSSNPSTCPAYQAVRSRFGVELTDLAVLTNFNVGKSTIAMLSADPSRLVSVLGQHQWSYLQYVPARYGHSECLTAATDVLLAKAQQVLTSSEPRTILCNRLYSKALCSLQHALSDECMAVDADVLAATQLLSLHELLDSSRQTAWSHHVDGSARLMKHRSPSRFRTEYEKSLLAAHVGAVMSESLVNNVHCYLEQPEWIDLYSSLRQDGSFLTDRDGLAITVRRAMFSLPGIWHDVGEVVNSPGYYICVPMDALEKRCRKSHKALLDWLEDYKSHCVRLSLAQPPASEIALRRELFGLAMECLVIVKRLLAAVRETDRQLLEMEVQALAHLILDLQKQPSPKHSWLFSGIEVGVASSMLLTKDQWEEDVSHKGAEERIQASRNRYNAWNNSIRMSH